MRKIKMIILLLVCALSICTPVAVLASGSARRENIQSKGKIDFANGTVVLDSADLFSLADQVDVLESTYKIAVVDALNVLGTYFRNDGGTTNNVENNEVDSDEEKAALSFANLKAGILQSQSVESLAEVQAVNKDGNGLFFANEEAATNKNLLQTTTENTGMAVYYRPITAENLTAGTAAWVNGHLIIGNGGDNASCYAQGVIDGQANIMDNLNVTYTYHYHEGDTENGGGCYEQVTDSTTCGTIILYREYYRGHTCGSWCSSYYEKEYICGSCRKVTGRQCAGGGNSCGSMSGQIGGSHVITTTSWAPACGYSQGQILTATIVY